jgi:outer membrane protein assembly factor BamE (lipoprotein component of BamABCDE complex)
MRYLKILSTTIFLCLAIGLAFQLPCTAQEDETTKLRQKITELETRIKELETTLTKYQEHEKGGRDSSNTWENKKNWRKLETGMSRDKVLSLLGEPIKTIEGVKTLWYYPDIYRGYVSFDDKGKLTGWQEP